MERRAIAAKVLDAHGLTQVTALKANGSRLVSRLHTTAGLALDVTADHLVWRVDSGAAAPRAQRRGRFVPAGDIVPGDCLEWHRTEAWGEGQITREAVAEAALVGWLQGAGFVGERGRSIECITVTEAERHWVLDTIESTLPVSIPSEASTGADAGLDRRRIRVEGSEAAALVKRWGLDEAMSDSHTPEPVLTAALPVVAGYLASLFQTVGFVSPRPRGCVVGLAMRSEGLVRGAQLLLGRFGIFARIRIVTDPRPSEPSFWVLNVGVGEVRRFADEVGFVDPAKAGEMGPGLSQPVVEVPPQTRELVVSDVQQLGLAEVYQIDTESGEYLSSNLRIGS